MAHTPDTLFFSCIFFKRIEALNKKKKPFICFKIGLTSLSVMSSLTLDIIGILFGFAIMILGAERLIKGASDLALMFNLSKAFVGAILVGFGTSAPELFTSFYSAYIGEGTLSAGNVIGSNVFNSTLVMSTCLMFTFKIKKAERHFSNWIFIILPALLLVIFMRDLSVTRLEGALLLLPLPFFFYILLKQGNLEDEVVESNSTAFLSLLWIIIGVFALYLGSNLSIDSSLKVADHFNLSKGFAGAIILASGTSLPELVTTIIAGVKKEISLALANIVGSNALNAFGVLGGAALFYPFSVTESMGHQNTIILLIISVMLIPLLIIKSNLFHKLWAGLLFMMYFVFFTSN